LTQVALSSSGRFTAFDYLVTLTVRASDGDERHGPFLPDSGYEDKAQCDSNRSLSPLLKHYHLLFADGICRLGELIDLGEATGITEKSGSWLSAGGERLGQGREKAREALKQNPELLNSLEQQVLESKNVHRVTTRTSVN
jgi:hypothetical protein